jgi:hypothetical protein
MFAKVLAGVLGALVLSVGGYAYWQYLDGDPGAACCSQTQGTATDSAAAEPDCCSEASRACVLSASALPACCGESPAAAEVLTIAPREVN